MLRSTNRSVDETTHAFLFAIGDPDKLPPSARNALPDPKPVSWVSAVSIWEIALKVQIGKLELPVAPALYREHIRKLRANVLSVESRHSVEHFRLPPPQRAPFDLLLIARARVDDMTPGDQRRANRGLFRPHPVVTASA